MPKTQTKEEIEADLRALRNTALTDFANTLTLQLIAVVEEPTDCVIVAGTILAAVLGNSAELNEEKVKTLFAGVFERVERLARSVMTSRANLEAVAKIMGGGQ